jgi:hypothetical protein
MPVQNRVITFKIQRELGFMSPLHETAARKGPIYVFCKASENQISDRPVKTCYRKPTSSRLKSASASGIMPDQAVRFLLGVDPSWLIS